MRTCLLIIFSILAAPTRAGELDKLVDAEQKCLSSIAATSAKLIKLDKNLSKINRLIKKHQQFVYLKVRESAAIKALAELEKTKPIEYRQQFARERLKVIADNPEIRDRIEEIRRLQDAIERALDKNPSIQNGKKRLLQIRSGLHALRR